MLDTIDILIYIAIGIAAIVGYRMGIIQQVGSLSALLLALLACYFFGDVATDCAALFMGADSATALPQEEYWGAMLLGHILLFVAVWLSVGIISRLLKKIAKAACLGPIDGLFGATFMTLKILIAISIILNIWAFIAPENDFLNSGSQTTKFTAELCPALLGIVSENL